MANKNHAKNNFPAFSDFMDNSIEAKRVDTENSGRDSKSVAGPEEKKSVGNFGFGASSKGCFTLVEARDLGIVQPVTVHLGVTDD